MDIKASDKAKELILKGKSKVEIADKLGITRQTLATRIKLHNWKKSESALLRTIN